MSLAGDESFKPQPGKTGWPWTLEASSREAISRPLKESFDWPKITIVTPSYNQGQFIEETIRSVLLQGYPNLEYFIMDAGSTDGTVEIIKKYERWLAGWVSEKDRGMAHAINKGWGRANGEILAYINSDDWYYPGVLWSIAEFFAKHSDVSWFAGEVNMGWSPDAIANRHVPKRTSLAECMGRKNYGFHQPGMFWRRSLIESVGKLNETKHYSFCHDFWIRSLLQNYEPYCHDQPITFFRLHSDSQSVSTKHHFIHGDWMVFEKYKNKLSPDERRQAKRWLQEYEADMLLDTVYGFLARGRRAVAIAYLLRRIHLFPKMQTKKPILGLIFRTLFSGHPPTWFKG